MHRAGLLSTRRGSGLARTLRVLCLGLFLALASMNATEAVDSQAIQEKVFSLAPAQIMLEGDNIIIDAEQDHKEDINPEGASGWQTHEARLARHGMVSAANPLAAQAGLEVLKAGGNAVDAAIATQWVLNLVEPQSSGIGGGGFMLTYEASTAKVRAWDGRETAVAASQPEQFMQEGKPMAFRDAVNNGSSVGTPGLVRLLSVVHAQQGRLPWADLFASAIALAEHGFPVSERLYRLLDDNDGLRQQAAARAYFYDAESRPWPVGHHLKNPALADVFRRLASEGPEAFYMGVLAQNMVDAVRKHGKPGRLAVSDLAAYQALEREPLCTPYKVYVLCGMPPPSSGPLAVMQMLGILSHTQIASLEPNSTLSLHYFSEAGRLAYADRDAYVGDPDFVDVPVQAMLDPRYLEHRASLIDERQSMGRAHAGRPQEWTQAPGQDDTPELPSTTHLVTADRWGNVVSMTTSIESAFGSKIFVEGFLLNNQLTDFSFSQRDEHGVPLANRLEPGKRPRSSMAPMLVLKDGQPFMAIGSPGGSAIINYVAKALLGVLDWGLDIQRAIDLPNRGSRNRHTEIENHTSLKRRMKELSRLGHEPREQDFPSGLQGMVFTKAGIEGGADPRREGVALGY